jgi:hypothetical protein
VGGATNGLQKKRECVLRDGPAPMRSTAGILWDGSKLYASPDGGASWTRLTDGLPPVVCVKTAVVGTAGRRETPSSSKVKPGRSQARDPRSEGEPRPRARPRAGRRRRSRDRASGRAVPDPVVFAAIHWREAASRAGRAAGDGRRSARSAAVAASGVQDRVLTEQGDAADVNVFVGDESTWVYRRPRVASRRRGDDRSRGERGLWSLTARPDSAKDAGFFTRL